jgi:hypothetical protein
MVCDAYGVEDEEELPKQIQEIDVVKFAERSPAEIESIVVKQKKHSSCDWGELLKC